MFRIVKFCKQTLPYALSYSAVQQLKLHMVLGQFQKIDLPSLTSSSIQCQRYYSAKKSKGF